jgi:hypothetical protein
MAITKNKNGELEVEQIKQKIITAKLIGTSPLILSKKARSYELMEVFKQSHNRGTEIPKSLDQPYNLYERLITSIHWRDHIDYHEDYSEYTEEEWRNLMENNAPCIHQLMLTGAMKEAFISFGFKDSTGKNGTDLTRCTTFDNTFYPVRFKAYDYEQKLVPNNGKDRTNVICEHNIFEGWTAEVSLICATIGFPIETVLSILNTAGQFIGVGSQHKNGYGHFVLGDIKIADVAIATV